MNAKGLRRIWVVNYAGHNMASALDHVQNGTSDSFVYMTQGAVNIFETDRVRHEFDEMFKTFDPQRDALLLSGSSVLNILAVLSAVRRFNEITVLIWHAKGREYIRRNIRLGEEVS